MWGLSLRARVLAGMAVVVATLVLVALTVTATTRSYLIGQIDDRLAAAEGPERNDVGPHGPPRGGPGDRLGDLYEGVIGADGELRTIFPSNPSGQDLADPAIDPTRASDAASTGEPFTVGAQDGSGLRYRVRVRASDEGLHVTALPLTAADDTVSRLITVEVVATSIIAVVLGAVAWWVIRLGIRPIKRMTQTATAIADGERGDLSQRVPAMAPSTEAGQLGAALNHMLQTLEAAFAERSESQDRLRRFVADASHELRTPVTTIRGYAELYRIGGLTEANELDEAMRRTEQEAVRMARLVDDLLALAKYDEGRPLDRRPTDLTGLVADAARDARAVDPGRPISTDLDGPVVVLGDEDRLRQVLANVVGNALVHTPRGVPIELAATKADGTARITVVDHGPGMAPEVAARVTERFYRADRGRARDRGGSGLGLAIADTAVLAHGGTITVDSAVGAGTTVTVTLPLAR